MREAIQQHLHELGEKWRVALREHAKLVRRVGIAFAAIAVFVVVSGVWFLASLLRTLPDQEQVGRIGEMAQSTAVYDDGDRFTFTISQEQRLEVPLSEVSPHLTHALVATEDQRFYEHHGFDIKRIAAAALANVRRHRLTQGGSTLTQQLARQSFLKPDKTIRRKLQELILAARLESLYSKDRILELYLNKVYFGDGLYGAEAASRGYFGKHASELSVGEAALLAGLVKSPSSYAPTVNLQRAAARRNMVLQAMLDAGSIDAATWRSARAAHVALHDDLRAHEPHGQYFKEQVRRELIDRFGWQRVYQGGLRVFTTIDMPMQIAAESAVDEWLKALEQQRAAIRARRLALKANQAKRANKPPPSAEPRTGAQEPLQAALVALDPQTGHVRAMVGGRDFSESHFNRAMQARRQPGSAFKPFVYAAALEEGYTPATVIDRLNEPIETWRGAWTPEDGHSTADAMTLRTALRISSNRAAVRLLQRVGISTAVQYARNMGVGELPSVPSLALGSGEVTLDTLTAAYAGFANHGLVPKPILIRRVEDQEGRALYQVRESPARAISETTAFLMSTMLADVVNAGTGARARRLGFTLPAAGKTGTTNDFNDAWFVGFTPKLATGVWVGFDQPHTILPNGFAAEIAVPVWAKFMKVATRGDSPEWFTPPPSVTTAQVCRMSGKLATDGCRDVEVVNNRGEVENRSMVYTEYFPRGAEPTAVCDLHPSRDLFEKVASLVGIGTQPEPLTVDDTSPPPVPTSSSGESRLRAETLPAQAPRAETVPPQAPRKQRGFWSKVFGIGGDDDADRATDGDNPPKK